MGPLLSMAGALLLATTPPVTCYVPSDQTVGWKQVALPSEAPALAAPADLDQFRTGERALLSEEDPRNVYLGASKQNFGRMAYTFRLPRGTSQVELGFLDSLNGAKVDATVYVGPRAYPLLSERRQAGQLLALSWGVADVDGLVVEVHHHLREVPAVLHWRLYRQVVPSQEASVPASFQVARTLYFWHPGGRRIQLCDTPGQPMALSRWPEGAPVAVTLTPVPSSP